MSVIMCELVKDRCVYMRKRREGEGEERESKLYEKWSLIEGEKYEK